MAGLVPLGLYAVLASGGVQVDAGDGADCPPPLVLEARLANRVPARPGASATPRWLLRYRSTAVDARTGRRSIAVELMDPAGQPHLRRQLTVTARECDLTAATAIAAIVERFFRAIGWTAGAPLPPSATPAEPAPPPAAGATAAPAPAASGRAPGSPVRAPRVEPAGDRAAATPAAPPAGDAAAHRPAPGPRVGPPAAPGRVALAVAAGPAVWLAHEPALRVVVALRGESTGLPVRAGVAALLPGAATREAGEGAGSASQTAWPVRFTLAAFSRRGAWELEGGLDLMATVDSAASTGITLPAARTRLSLAAGPGAAAAFDLASRWRLRVGLAAHRHVAGSRFYFEQSEGGRRYVLDWPAWQGLGTVELAYRLAM